jgi:hypothetical protein
MAIIDLNLGGLGNPSTQTIDQSDIGPDDVLRANLLGNTNLTVTNTEGVEAPLELQQAIAVGVLPTNTLTLGENAHVALLPPVLGLNIAGTFNYNLGADSTLELSSAFLNVGLLNTLNVDMGAQGSSTLVYDASGINVSISAPPNVTGISAGDQIQVAGATSGAYENGQLVFRNELGLTWSNSMAARCRTPAT